MPTVAIAAEFLDAFARLPRAQQKKVREFTEKFKTDPKSAAINYEKIHAVKDPKVRTVRIDQKYRAIILHPDEGDVYVLMWVDNHDEAMAWAEDRIFEINPHTGALQVVSVSEAIETIQSHPKHKKSAGFLAQFDDDLLLSFGVPSVLLPAVRAIEKPEELLSLTKHLPAEASESLIWLAEGMPPEEVREAVVSQPKKVKVDLADLDAALQHPDSRRRFVTILANLCGDERVKIEVVHLHAWAVRFMRDRGVEINVIIETPDQLEGKNTYNTLKALGNSVATRCRVLLWPLNVRGKDTNGKPGILHVKCAVADGRSLFLSSANLTDYAFTINMELGLLVTGGKLPGQVERQFERLIETGCLAVA